MSIEKNWIETFKELWNAVIENHKEIKWSDTVSHEDVLRRMVKER